jgi:ferredoxin--NADP+ reductase
MQPMANQGVDDTGIHSAVLIQSDRITPAASREEVRQLVFRTDDLSFDGRAGNCIRVMAPGRFGNKHHARLYSIADVDQDSRDSTRFSLCVRRCFYIDEFNGEQYAGVASNYLCDLAPGQTIQFAGPIGYPFPVPGDRNADIIMIGMGTGIAPFRALIRQIYEQAGGWNGRVRLYYGARTGLEMLYMNDENNDLANYFDQATFKAFKAISPRPHFDVPVALDAAIEQNAAEVWEMMNSPDTHVYLAGTTAMAAMVEKALTNIAGSAEQWNEARGMLVASGRWREVLY